MAKIMTERHGRRSLLQCLSFEYSHVSHEGGDYLSQALKKGQRLRADLFLNVR